MRNIFLIVSVLLLSGCAVLDPLERNYGDVRGSWKYKDAVANPLVLTFKKNNAYELDYNRDGIKDIWGEYKISNNWIILKDIGGDFAPDCGHEGAYTFKVSGNKAEFTIIADQCPYRAQALSSAWERSYHGSKVGFIRKEK